nr:immunoglobulin heavy chain junction region [Macaca mulatta]MOW94881.1 immunoglobulin heavy chain junction region [Macaca mulatta]
CVRNFGRFSYGYWYFHLW